MSYKNKIFITLTSWKGRINTITPIIQSLINQTVKVNRIFLNLSEEEFKNKYDDLPLDLLNLQTDMFVINWVGKDTKTMKKVLPTLDLINDEDILIFVDDDVIYPSDLVESRLNDFYERENGENPITGHYFKINSLNLYCSACGSLIQKKMLKGYKEFVNNDVIKTYEDDWLYMILALINGYKFKPCSKYSIADFRFINQETSSGNNNLYNSSITEKVLRERVTEVYGKTLDDYLTIIPKIIHYCWFGKKDLPIDVKNRINEWRNKCPNFEIKEWNETNFPYEKYNFSNKAYQKEQYAHVSDVARLYALYKEGGVYLDIDVEVLKDLTPLLRYEDFIAYEYENLKSVNTGCIGAQKGSKWIKDFFDCCYGKIEDIKELDNIYNSVVLANFLKNYGGKKPEVLPIDWLSNVDHEKKYNTYTYHLFAHSWWIDKINKDYKDNKVNKINITTNNNQESVYFNKTPLERLEEIRLNILNKL